MACADKDILRCTQLQNATFTATGPLAFLPNWKPVLDYPDEQLRQLSPGGWDEL